MPSAACADAGPVRRPDAVDRVTVIGSMSQAKRAGVVHGEIYQLGCASIPIVEGLRPHPVTWSVRLEPDLVEFREVVVGEREAGAGDVLVQVRHR